MIEKTREQIAIETVSERIELSNYAIKGLADSIVLLCNAIDEVRDRLDTIEKQLDRIEREVR